MTGPGNDSVVEDAPASTALEEKVSRRLTVRKTNERSAETIWRDVLIRDVNSGNRTDRAERERCELREGECKDEHARQQLRNRLPACLHSHVYRVNLYASDNASKLR